MYVRLAFAVAAHLESEILIVDEVLAVGDAEFQKKCLGKMGEVSQGEGRTVLFVSHNMGAIKKLCHKGLLLANGISLFNGNIDKCIDLYLDQNKTQAMARFALQNSHQAEITCVNLCNRDDVAVAEITAGSQWKVQIQFSVHEYTEDLILAIGLTDMYGMALNTTWQPAISLNKGTYITTFVQDEIHYALGKYFVHASISKGRSAFRFIENAIGFDMVEGSTHLSDHILNLSYNTGAIINQMRCYTTKVDEEMV
jgi:lipopolysaccharide transport system ATP-binding protein